MIELTDIAEGPEGAPDEGPIGTIMEHLDVAAETGFSLAKLEKPKGYNEALEKFRSRSPLVQIALGVVFDPLIVLGALKLPVHASRAAIRSAAASELRRTMPRASDEIIEAAADDVARRIKDTVEQAEEQGGRASRDPRSLNFQTNADEVVAGSKRTVSEITDAASKAGRSLTQDEINEIRASVRSQVGATLRPAGESSTTAALRDAVQGRSRESRASGADLGPERVPESSITTALRDALRQSNAPIDPPRTPPSSGPGLSAHPPSNRPRTLTDLNREAKGIRGLTPEARAQVMDTSAPLGEVLYKHRPYGESAERLLGPDSLVNKGIRSVPGLRNAAALVNPAAIGRTNPVQMIGVRSAIFKEVERGRARFAGLRWWNEADDLLGFKKQRNIWRATKINVAEGATTDSRTVGTINDLVEHPERYDLTAGQRKVLQMGMDMQTQMLRDAQRAGVNVTELSVNYWHRIVTKAPGGKAGLVGLKEDFIRGRLGSRKGHTLQRAFNDIDEGIELGYGYETHPLRTLVTRLEAGIDTIADARVLGEIKRLPNVETAAQRRSPAVAEALATAREARDAAVDIAKRSVGGSNEVSSVLDMRQAEADYVVALRDAYVESRAAGQSGYRELSLPNGRIAPSDLVDEVQKYIDLPELNRGRGAGALALTGESFRMLRTVLTTMDLAAGYIQGQILFLRNNVAWWKAQAHSVVSLVDDPHAYVAKNYDIIDEGVQMGAISPPTEFLFARQGIGSIPTRIPLAGPALTAFNRAFEWFILVGQTELYKAGRSKIIEGRIVEGTINKTAVEELVSLGSAVRKEVGTSSMAILGVRPTQQTIESLLFFASSFLRANTGIMAQSLTAGAGGAEARRAMGALLGGGLSITIGAHWALTGKAPNLDDPFAPDWMQVPIGQTYFNAFGPFYPYFRYLARTGIYVSRGELDKAARETARFGKSKASLLFRAATIGADIAATGESRTFEGDRITTNPLSLAKGVLGEFAVPIAPGEITQGLREGRPESIAEIIGLTGRSSPFAQMDILFQKSPDINPDSVSLKDADPAQMDEMNQRYPEIAERILKSGRGKFGEARRQWADIDVANFAREEALAQEFQSGITTGESFRDAYSSLQERRRSEKAGVNAGLGLFQEEQDLPDDPNERALAEYYRAQEGAVRESGIYDFEEAEKSIADLDATWTAEQKAYIDRNTGRSTHPPLIQEFRDDVVFLKPFWDIRDKVIDGLSPGDRDAWDSYNRDEITRKELSGTVSGILDHIKELQNAWIFDHAETPRVDLALLRWGYRTDAHSDEGAEFIDNRLRSPDTLYGPPQTPQTQQPAPSGDLEHLEQLFSGNQGADTGGDLEHLEEIFAGTQR